MTILINTSNLSKGGGIQVADSVIRYLHRYPQHTFIVVLSKGMEETADRLTDTENVRVAHFTLPPRDTRSYLTGRVPFLDTLVSKYSVDCVLSIFGPITWHPKCPHVCGFAIPHLVIPESPYFKMLSKKDYLRTKLFILINRIKFQLGTKYLYTENPLISTRVAKLIKGSHVRTITNNYNQIFDQPDNCKPISLPSFEGTTLLTVSSSYPHKNLGIAINIADDLESIAPDFSFRFVFTVKKDDYPAVPERLSKHFVFLGSVDISSVPSLYSQCDIVFHPSLLECFSSVYTEAMKMQKPLLVADMVFSRGLCEDAALYYSPISHEEAARRILELASNASLRTSLIKSGLVQLEKFDTAMDRSDKLIKYCEDLIS